MNTHRLIAMGLAVALAGFTLILAAEENISVPRSNETVEQNTVEQKLETGILTSETDRPLQVSAQPTDKLLSELKVYPAF